jgi:pimeloyl-ACP methyl ester carboxylesterase
MREHTLQFGARDRLVGTICLPEAEGSTAASPRAEIGVVSFNAGFISRHGPHRLNVKLSRFLAGRGFPSLRFDLSGLGDSNPFPGDLEMSARTRQDLKDAVDLLCARTGVEKVILIGLCSGTDACLDAAAADARAAGLYLLDPWAFATPRSRLNTLQKKIGRHGTFVRVLLAATRALRDLSSGRSGATPGDRLRAAALDVRVKPAPQEFARLLQAASRHGASLHILYTGSSTATYNYDSQFRELFAPLGVPTTIAVEYRPDYSHMFTEIWMQAELLDRLAGWCERLRARGSATAVAMTANA